MKYLEKLRAAHKLAWAWAMMVLGSFVTNKKGAVAAKDVIFAAVGFLLVAVLTPVGMNQVGKASNWSNWDTTVATIFTVLVPILYLIGVALYFVKEAT